MPQLSLTQAQTIITAALKHGTDAKMQPLAVVQLPRDRRDESPGVSRCGHHDINDLSRRTPSRSK